jgi:hypothetical protein
MTTNHRTWCGILDSSQRNGPGLVEADDYPTDLSVMSKAWRKRDDLNCNQNAGEDRSFGRVAAIREPAAVIGNMRMQK